MNKDSKKPKNPSLPSDAMRFSKQLGVDLVGLEPEAKAIWEHLEELASKDPLEYQRFISAQMQAAKEEESSGKKKNSATFRPTAGFCVSVKTQGGDGMKVRDATSDGRLLYINVCGSALIEEAIDKNGNKVNLDRATQTADGLQIPLVVGPVRTMKISDANAIDVIVNPKVIDTCLSQRYFLAQVVDLALEWIVQETELRFNAKKWEDVKERKYMGGLGDSFDTPVLFHVDSEAEEAKRQQAEKGRNSNGASKATSGGEFSTSNILSEIHDRERKKDDISILKAKTSEEELIKTSTNKQDKPKKTVRIEEINSITSSSSSSASFQVTEMPPVSVSSQLAETSIQTSKVNQRDGPDKADQQPNKMYKPPSKLETEDLANLLERSDEDVAFAERDKLGRNDDDVSNILSDLAKAFMRTTPGLIDPSSSHPPDPKSSSSMTAPPLGSPIVESNTLKKTLDDRNEVTPIVNNPLPEFVVVNTYNSEDKASLIVSLEGVKAGSDISSLQLQASINELQIICDPSIFERYNGSNRTIKVEIITNGFNNKKATASYKRKLGKIIVTIPK